MSSIYFILTDDSHLECIQYQVSEDKFVTFQVSLYKI